MTIAKKITIGVLSCGLAVTVATGIGALRKAYAEPEPELTPAVYLKLDDTAAKDEVSGTNMTVKGTPIVGEESENKYWTFGGSTGIVIDTAPAYDEAFTMELKFRVGEVTSQMALVARTDLGGQRNWGLFVSMNTLSHRPQIHLNIYSSSKVNGTDMWQYLKTYIDGDTWNDVVVTYSEGLFTMYVNGVCAGVVKQSDPVPKTSPLAIGYLPKGDTITQGYKGDMDEFKYYRGVKEPQDDLKELVPTEGLTHRYNFEHASSAGIRDDVTGTENAKFSPDLYNAQQDNNAIRDGFNGKGLDCIETNHVMQTDYTINGGDFAFSMYFNPSAPGDGDQTLIGQANYGAGQREFTLNISNTAKLLRLQVRVGDAWVTQKIGEVEANKWYHVAVSIKNGEATAWLNGFRTNMVDVSGGTTGTGVNLTIGGVISNTKPNQVFKGKIDDVCIYNRALTEEEVLASISDEIAKRTRGEQVHIDERDPELIPIEDVTFATVSKSDPNGFKWQHGGAITYHNGYFWASMGRNRGAENTAGEEAHVFRSTDAIHWEYNATLGEAEEGKAYSHGSIFEGADGKLYAFAPFYAGADYSMSSSGICFKECVMRGFVYDDDSETWSPYGTQTDDFWPNHQAFKMENGNWIMAGTDHNWRAAVAISDGDDFSTWRVVKIPFFATAFTECSIVVEGSKVTIYMRNQAALDTTNITAGISVSNDYGETWTEAEESDLSLCTSKPASLILSTGERVLIGNSVQGANGYRTSLTMAVAEAGSDVFTHTYLIRDVSIPRDLLPDKTLECNLALAYPYAYEHEGKLYVIYSAAIADGNINDIEVAIIDLSFLENERAARAFKAEYAETLANPEMTAEEVGEISEAYGELSDGAKRALVRDGFTGALTDAEKKAADKAARAALAETLEEIDAIIDASTATTLESDVRQVQALYGGLSARSRAWIEADELSKIEAFLLFAE